MKLAKHNTAKRFETPRNTLKGVLSYGENNDYPQALREIISASGTGKACAGVYAKFIKGKGFLSPEVGDIVVNCDGESLRDICLKISDDLGLYGGVAVHVNVNILGEVVSLRHIPFEHVRFEDVTRDNPVVTRYAVYDDWGRRTKLRSIFDERLVTWYDAFDPDKAKRMNPDDLKTYTGQLYYYSNEGNNVYPLAIYDAVVTDMNTEEGVSNVLNRNARNNLFAAGMLVNIDGDEESEEADNDVSSTFRDFMGDENAGNIAVATVTSKEEVPIFLDFSGKNYDKELEVTTNTVKDKIGRAFTQPPILRAEDVGANFGAEALKNAYHFYNSITEAEREVISSILSNILAFMPGQDKTDCSIEALTYQVENNPAEELNGEQRELFNRILFEDTAPDEVKKRRLKALFNYSDDFVNELF